MPTISQLVRAGRKQIVSKTKSPALQITKKTPQTSVTGGLWRIKPGSAIRAWRLMLKNPTNVVVFGSSGRSKTPSTGLNSGAS